MHKDLIKEAGGGGGGTHNKIPFIKLKTWTKSLKNQKSGE